MRRRKSMSLIEAIDIFGFDHPGCKVTKDLIGKTFKKLCFAVHPDKNKTISKEQAAIMVTKYSDAKKVLLENIEAIPETKVEGKVNSVFVDYLKTVDTKNRKSPFTVYKKGKGK